MHERLRRDWLNRWSSMLNRHPWWILGTTSALAVACIVLTVLMLRFEPDRNALISKDLSWHARYLQYLEDFEGTDSILAVVEVPQGENGRERAKAFVDHLAAQLNTEGMPFRQVAWGFDPNSASPILLRLQDRPGFGETLDRIRSLRPLLAADDAGAITRGIAQAAPPDPWFYMQSDDGELLLMNLIPQPDPDAMDPFEPVVKAAHFALDVSREAFPDIRAGLTGIPVLESAESESAMNDATRCSLLAVVGVAALLLIAFRGVWLPLMILAALGIGVAWSFGFLTLTIGHLQMLSLFFTAMLLGLGIDFGIHLLCAYQQQRRLEAPGPEGFEPTLRHAVEKSGPGIVTGAITTSIAFGTTLLTDYKGMAEMGLIAGVGILLCLLAMFTALPVIIRILRPQLPKHAPSRFEAAWPPPAWIAPFERHPKFTAFAALCATAVCLPWLFNARFDYNLMNLYPQGLPAVEWQQRLQNHSTRAIWYGVSITDDLDEARRRVERFRELQSVASVGGVGELFPPDEAQKIEALAALRADLGEALLTPPSEEVIEQANVLQRVALRQQAKVRTKVAQALQTRPLTPQDMPAALRHTMISKDGEHYQIHIYPKEDLWNPEKMEPFIEQLRSIDPDVTGSPVQIYESGILMQKSYVRAGWMALLACFILVWLDFRRLRDALLCLLPVSVGFICLFGVLRLIGEPLNPANIIVLPLVFGIGIDAGVHMLHRFVADPEDHPAGLSKGTGKGIVLTGLSTIIGFAALTLAEHRGIRSLGLVLAVGVGLTLIVCLTVMPALLRLSQRYLSPVQTAESGDSGDASD